MNGPPQDATYFGLTPADGVVTCWIALSDASEAHGCMRVIRGSHTAGQLEHALKPGESGSMLRRGQQVEDVSASAGEVMALGAGEMSIHNPFTLHCSGPNTTQVWCTCELPQRSLLVRFPLISISIVHARRRG